MIYWDTSCVLKLYTAESDSAQWQDCATGTSEELVASRLLEAELAFALLRKEMQGDIRPGATARLLGKFQRDVQAGRFRLVPVGADVITRAGIVAETCYRAEPPVPLRTLDGLHLATAVLLGCTGIASADERMRRAAPLLGIPLISPPPD